MSFLRYACAFAIAFVSAPVSADSVGSVMLYNPQSREIITFVSTKSIVELPHGAKGASLMEVYRPDTGDIKYSVASVTFYCFDSSKPVAKTENQLFYAHGGKQIKGFRQATIYSQYGQVQRYVCMNNEQRQRAIGVDRFWRPVPDVVSLVDYADLMFRATSPDSMPAALAASNRRLDVSASSAVSDNDRSLAASQLAATPASTEIVEKIVETDSKGWFTNEFDRGSVHNVRVIGKPESGDVAFRGDYTYNSGASGWVIAKFSMGRFVCVEFWDGAGRCRTLRSPEVIRQLNDLAIAAVRSRPIPRSSESPEPVIVHERHQCPANWHWSDYWNDCMP